MSAGAAWTPRPGNLLITACCRGAFSRNNRCFAGRRSSQIFLDSRIKLGHGWGKAPKSSFPERTHGWKAGWGRRWIILSTIFVELRKDATTEYENVPTTQATIIASHIKVILFFNPCQAPANWPRCQSCGYVASYLAIYLDLNYLKLWIHMRIHSLFYDIWCDCSEVFSLTRAKLLYKCDIPFASFMTRHTWDN